MAVAQIYTAVPNDTITAARWNNEFGNIYNNGTALAFPLTTSVSLAGFTLTLDAAGASSFNSPATTGVTFTPGAKSGIPGTTGYAWNTVANTATDTNTAGSGTAAAATFTAFQRPTLAASNTVVTTTDGATVYIANSPANGTNETITNPWSLWVDAGNSRLDGNVSIQGESVVSVNPWRFTAAVGSNALTITLQTADGATPSASNAIPLAFRSSTLTTPQQTTALVNSATTLVISSGSTLGTANGVSSRIYVGVANDGGTLRLFAYNPLVAASLSLTGIQDNALYSSVAEGGAGAADSAQVLYSGTAFTSMPVHILGYIESTQATAGTWATAPSKVHMLRVGDKRTGDRVQFTNLQLTTATFTTASTTLVDITGLTLNITPTSDINLIDFDNTTTFSGSAAIAVSFLVLRGSTGILAGVAASNRIALSTETLSANAATMDQISIRGFDNPASTSAQTYKLQTRVGAGTMSLNRSFTDTDTAAFGRGVSIIRLTEIFV